MRRTTLAVAQFSCCWERCRKLPNFGPEIRRDYPLNLSISISGGEETNQDSPSNGERTGKSPA